jgi:predicted Zn-dependent protease
MEIAGVLSSLDRHREALAMFEGIPPQFVNRLLYTELLASAKDFARAEVELRALLKDKPDDKDLLFRYASVLTWGSKFDDATLLWTNLEQKYPEDRQIRTMAAFNQLWAKKFSPALARFDVLIRQYPEDPEIQRGFVDSVAGVEATELREPVRQKVVRIHDATVAEGVRSERDAQFLASLGAALSRFQDRDRSRAAFMKALTAYPQNRTLWRRFGEALYNMRFFDEAERIFSALVNGEVPRLAAFAPR